MKLLLVTLALVTLSYGQDYINLPSIQPRRVYFDTIGYVPAQKTYIIEKTIVERWDEYVSSTAVKFELAISLQVKSLKWLKHVEITWSGKDTVYFIYNHKYIPDDMIVKEQPTLNGFIEYLKGKK